MCESLLRICARVCALPHVPFFVGSNYGVANTLPTALPLALLQRTDSSSRCLAGLEQPASSL